MNIYLNSLTGAISTYSMMLQGTGFVLHRNPEISEAGDIGQSGNGNSMSAGGPKAIGALHHKYARFWDGIYRKDLPVKIASPDLVPITPPNGHDQPTNEYGGTYLEGANAPTAYKPGNHFSDSRRRKSRIIVPRGVHDLRDFQESLENDKPHTLPSGSGPN